MNKKAHDKEKIQVCNLSLRMKDQIFSNKY